jgi:methionyl-tRNA formyltransferase
MIHLLGHNPIVMNLSKTLSDWKVPFKVYSNTEIDIAEGCFVKIENPDTLIELLDADKEKKLILSAGAPWILNQSFLMKFEPEGIMNIHGTPLPQDRGGTLASWLILNKKRLGNAIIHKMTVNPDDGPILVSDEFIYPLHCQFPKDYIEVYNHHQELLATKLCKLWVENSIDLLKTSMQPEYLSTYWPRLNTDINATINWDWDGEHIELFIRAFDEPYKGAKTTWRGKKVHIKKAFFQRDNQFHPFQYGLIFRTRKTNNLHYLGVAVNGGSIYLEICNDEDGSSLLDKIKVGDRFISTAEEINLSKHRTVKTAKGFDRQKDG